MENELNDKYLHNGYLYFTCNGCDRLILRTEMTVDEYNEQAGYCNDCKVN